MMPELAELCALRAWLKRRLEGSVLTSVDFPKECFNDDTTRTSFTTCLPAIVEEVYTKGKENWIVVKGKEERRWYICFHLMLNGEVRLIKPSSSAFVRDICHFDGFDLHFIDRDKRLRLYVRDEKIAQSWIADIAPPFWNPDPKSSDVMDSKAFVKALQSKKTSIQSALSEQKISKGATISGCGKWMTWQATTQTKLDPSQKCSVQDSQSLRMLYTMMRHLTECLYSRLTTNLQDANLTNEEITKMISGIYTKSKIERKKLNA